MNVKSKIIRLSMAAIMLYFCTYAILSYKGSYVPGTTGVGGIKDYRWAPMYSYNNGSNNKFFFLFFFFSILLKY